MFGSQIDLAGSLKGQVSVKPEEHPDEMAARLEAERRNARIEDWKGIAVFAVILPQRLRLENSCSASQVRHKPRGSGFVEE